MQKKIYSVVRLQDGEIILTTDNFKKVILTIEKELEKLRFYFSDIHYPTLKERQALESWAELNYPNFSQTVYGEVFIVRRYVNDL